MSLIAASLLLVAPAAAQEAVPMITVIGQKLADWKGVLKSKDDATVCETRHSTGDDAIDAIGCAAMEACVLPLAPQIEEIAARDIGARKKRRAMNALYAREKVADCVSDTREQGIARLADERAGL